MSTTAPTTEIPQKSRSAEAEAGQSSGTGAAWDRIAPGYDACVTPTHLWLGNEALHRAAVHSGMHFLDVAAGSGALSIPAARLGAEVLAVDQSSVMLASLAQRASVEGLEIETRLMDGHALALDDNCFDMAGSQFGVMLFPDMPRGLREMARVIRPGGRVLVVAYGDPRRIEFLQLLVKAVRSVRQEFDGPPLDPPPLPFQLQDPERLRLELAAAGLKDVHVETIIESLEFRTGEELWRWLVSSNPIVEDLLAELELTDSERTVATETLESLLRERAARDASATLTNPINIGIGTK
jgi:ubiquinone/menaquinone biosynthesis C-methylase UbiE